jgi:hypothetical protein
MKSSVQIKLKGFAAANRDATVELRNEATGEVVQRKPFLDGSLMVRDIDPGPWQVRVVHPNLIQPLFESRIRVFPGASPTIVPIPVPEDLFVDNPIRDVADADLSPVQQAATSARDQAAHVTGKAPGEVIRASDWNTLADAVASLAGAVLELTALVSPRGHDHPEIAEKIGEVQENLRRFAEAYGKSLLELQREIEVEKLRKDASAALDAAGANQSTRDRVLGRIDTLERAGHSDTTVFTQQLSSTGQVLLTTVNDLANSQGEGAGEYLRHPAVQSVLQSARTYFDRGTQTSPEAELVTYRASGTQKVKGILGGL